MKLRYSLTTVFLCLAASGFSQGWSDAYDNALKSISGQDWEAARASFQEAVALRPEDQSKPTTLPGPVTEPRRWRDGAPYSPNFGSAYCAYQLGGSTSVTNRTQWNTTAIDEFETLLAKAQYSKEAFYFLRMLYTRTRNTELSQALSPRIAALGGNLKWRVDRAMLAPEENAAVESMFRPARTSTTLRPSDLGGPTTISIKPGGGNGVQPRYGTGEVVVIPTKYALVIGNSESMMDDRKLSFAASDALLIHNSLIEFAGYAAENVDVISNGSAVQILASAQALADRMPQDGTVLLYFTGAGFNIGGKDYWGGIDAETPQDSSHMVAVSDIYRMFLAKGASIFSFSQSHRPKESGLYFGKETPMFGRISQAHATIPDAEVFSLVTEGREVGAYTLAFSEILSDFRSNQIPVTEFVWHVFYKMRRGGGPQTPTLPVLIVLPADSRF